MNGCEHREIEELKEKTALLEEENRELWGILIKFYQEAGDLMKSKSFNYM
jgi:hypothetical protein